MTALARQQPPLTAHERDSLLRSLGVPATLTQAQRDSAHSVLMAMIAPMLEGVGKALATPKFQWLFLGLIVLVCAPPLALLVLTAYWLAARRSSGPGRLHPPVA
jgi:hypothetical protein